MPRLLALLSIALIFPGATSAQRLVEHTKVRMFLNEEVVVEGPLVKSDRGPGGAIWFSLGKPHPSATVVVVVPSHLVAAFGNPRDYEGKTVRVTGRPTTGESDGINPGARGSMALPRNPFIILEDPSKLKVVAPPVPKVP
ncbi:MAG TPA: hypothetical protein VIP80_17390 [Gemmatimonadales bacterium]|jgi:hypothetical protein